MTSKIERTLVSAIASAGLHLDAQQFTGKGHYKFLCVNEHGVKGVLTGSSSPSSRRYVKSFRADARRLARRLS